MTVVVEIAPCGTDGVAKVLAQIAALRSDVSEMAGAVVAEQLAPAILRHEQVGNAPVFQIDKDRTHLPSLVGNSRFDHFDEPGRRVEGQATGARPVEKVRSAVAVNIG